ncbi:MAG: hypothetical protein P4L31_01805 [Candidatus Babeliales bacterium]|nr:hypothetical protein [Candidatus Babeliales bacterium]
MKSDNKFEALTMIGRNGLYRPDKPHLVLSHEFLFNSYLGMLTGIFDEGYSWTDAVKGELLDPHSTGICNDMIYITIKNNKVTIDSQPDMDNSPEDNAIEINRQILLAIINKWNELDAKGYQQITFTRHEDGSITLTGK